MIRGIIIILFLAVYGCNAQEKLESNVADVTLETNEKLDKFTVVSTEGPKKNWVMNADEAEFVDTDKGAAVKAKGLNAEFFTESENTILNSQIGIYYKDTRELEASGKVEVKSEKKRIITSDIKWNPNIERFTTEKNVIIFTEEGTLKGKGMEATMDLSEITIKGEISGEIGQ